MKGSLAFVILAFAAVLSAQTPQVKSGSTVFIEPMGGYEGYLAAALLKKHVQLAIVTDRSKADFVISSTVSRRQTAQPGVVINNRVSVNNGNDDAWSKGWDAGSGYPRPGALGRTDASISVIDAKTSQIVFAYSAGSYRSNQIEKTAEDCAKHLKEFIDKSDKGSK